MRDTTLLLLAPLAVCLVWIAILSIGTHLHVFEFSEEDSSVPLVLGSYIVSFALYFYVFLLLTWVVLFVAGVPLSGTVVKNNLLAVVVMLVLITIFPGTKSGFIAFDFRDLLMLPAWTVHAWLDHVGVIRVGEIPDSRASEKLLEALKSRNAETRRKAVKELGARMDVRAVEPLTVLLKNDEDWYVMLFAADALGRINDPRAIPWLVDFWKHGGKGGGTSNHESAEQALSLMDNPQAIAEFVTVLEDPDAGQLQNVAAKALGKIGDRSAVQPLIAALAAKEVAVEVVEALGELGDPRAATPLLSVLKKSITSPSYSSDKLRVAAIQALGKIKNPVAVDPLIALLKDRDKSVQSAAVEALGEIGDERAIPHIIPFLKAQDYSLKQAAAHALAHTKDDHALQSLINVLARSKDSSLKRSVAWSLGTISDPRVVVPLAEALEKDENSEVREMAAHSLGRTGNAQAVAPLIAALKAESIELRVIAARSLGELRDVRAIEPLIAAQGDASQSIAGQATLSLDTINDPKATAAVETYLTRFDLLKTVKNYERLIRKGDRNNEYLLLFALKRQGNEQMAHDFVTSDHWMLKEAGEAWLLSHGLKPKLRARLDAPEWGVKSRR